MNFRDQIVSLVRAHGSNGALDEDAVGRLSEDILAILTPYVIRKCAAVRREEARRLRGRVEGCLEEVFRLSED